MICDIKFATVSQSENITIGPEEKQREFDPKPRFLGNEFSMIRNSIGGELTKSLTLC